MPDKYNGEQILVFHRALLEGLGIFQGTSRAASTYIDVILSKENNHFYPRAAAESDESLQQIIPYVLFRYDNKIFSYVRGKGAGESRLLGNRSIGVGGHINPCDADPEGSSNTTNVETYLRAVRREIEEEVEVTGPFEPRIIGLINDDSNPVGRVHFGIVHLCDLTGPYVKRKESQLTQSGFLDIDELCGPRRDELETWSALAIDLLRDTPHA